MLLAAPLLCNYNRNAEPYSFHTSAALFQHKRHKFFCFRSCFIETGFFCHGKGKRGVIWITIFLLFNNNNKWEILIKYRDSFVGLMEVACEFWTEGVFFFSYHFKVTNGKISQTSPSLPLFMMHWTSVSYHKDDNEVISILSSGIGKI